MINSICLFLMALMGIVGFCLVTFFNNADEQREPVDLGVIQFPYIPWVKRRFYMIVLGIRLFNWLISIFNRLLLRIFSNRIINKVCSWTRVNRFGFFAWCLCVFFAYFPIAIIEGQIHPQSDFGYTHAFIGDVVGMSFLTWAIVIRRGNIACLLGIRKAKRELETFKKGSKI